MYVGRNQNIPAVQVEGLGAYEYHLTETQATSH